MKRIAWLKKLFGIFFLPAFIPFAHADVGDVLSKFHPYIALQEEYSDNINLTSANRKDDFITTVAPGLRFSTSPVPSSLWLALSLTLSYLEDDSNVATAGYRESRVAL